MTTIFGLNKFVSSDVQKWVTLTGRNLASTSGLLANSLLKIKQPCMTFSNFRKKWNQDKKFFKTLIREKDTLDHSAAEGLFLANHTQLKPIHYSGFLR